MLELNREARLAEPIAVVFTTLLRALGRGRWTSERSLEVFTALPRSGFQYSARHHGRLRRGEVIECLRPVSIVVLETLHKPPSCVRVRQCWRIQPMPMDTRLSCDLHASLNRIANLHRRQWEARFTREVDKLLDDVRSDLDAACHAHRGASGALGQSTGSVSIVSTNNSIVNGKPTLR
jgi:hypothetical protein